MFVIIIYDPKNSELIIYRDRAGVKPIYYYFDHDLLIFGSELKALVKHPSFPKDLEIDSIVDYFDYGYIPNPKSIELYSKVEVNSHVAAGTPNLRDVVPMYQSCHP